MSETIPEPVRAFVHGLSNAVQNKNAGQLHAHAENHWAKVSEKLYKQSEWPSAEAVAPLVKNDPIVLFLYKELSNRHLHTRLSKQLTLVQRVASWRNYTTFFGLLLDAETPLDLVLPVSWIWDTLDEFVYQYEEFCQYRSRKDLHDEEVALLKENPQVWNTVTVLKVLHRLADKADIRNVVKAEQEGQTPQYSSPFAVSELYQWYGYLALISLSRMHAITGDYYSAVKALDSINVDQKRVRFAKVTGAFVALHYYLGFSYLMMHRYRDAHKVFERVLLYISRMKQFHTRQYDQKKSEKMYALLAILLTFCPRRVDENVAYILRQEHADKVASMQAGDAESLFVYACPKFVTPSVPDYGKDELLQFHLLQKKVFLREVQLQAGLPTLRAYLKLYSSASLEKLASLLGKTQDELSLLSLVHKNLQKQCKTGQPAIEGELKPSVPISFHIDKNTMNLQDNTTVRQFGEHFLRGITKLNGIDKDLRH